MKRQFLVLALLALLALGAPHLRAAPSSDRFILSAERQGRWELYSLGSGGTLTQLTKDFSPARAPSLSADGNSLAFQSHRDGNWEIYSLNLQTGEARRLTNGMAYDGAPSWSPDGRKIAFESYQDDDLDIWVMNADGTSAENLTSNEPAQDFGPAWSPQGNWIAYTSWSTGHKQIFVASPDGNQRLNVSADRFDDEQPAWSPDGKRLAFVSNREGCETVTDEIALSACQRKEIYTADFDGARLVNVRQLSYGGYDTAPKWSPDGRSIAYISPEPDRQVLRVVGIDGKQARSISTGAPWLGSAAWSTAAPGIGNTPGDLEPLYVEKPIAAPAEAGHPYALEEIEQIYLAPSWGMVSSRIASSLLSLKERVQEESGLNFLGVLSDMTRDISFPCDVHCDTLSWHKAGRAVDTRLEYYDSNGRSLLEIVREDQLGETYWHLYLRAAVQNGSMGEPLHDAPWDLSPRSREVLGPEQGGVEAAVPYGYYVDFTELAREYGWTRISSHDDPDFDWKSNRLAMEYWHYQKTDGLTWYEAMQEIYTASDLHYNFDWNRAQSEWAIDDMHLYFKHIPPPPSAWKWFALIPTQQKR